MNVDIENDTSLQDDVRAAFESVAKAEGLEVETPKPSNEVLPPVVTETEEGAERDAQGRFLPKNKEEKAPEVQTPEPKVPAEAKPEGQEVTPPEGQTPPVKLDASKPPQGWTPALKEKWGTIPEDIRGEIIKREEDMAAGVQRIQQQYEPARQVFSEFAQHAQYFEHINMHPIQYIRNMIAAEQTLTLGNPAQKFTKLLELADDYGVPIRAALDQAMGGKLEHFIAESHKLHQTPPTLPPQVAQELAESRQFREQLESQAAQHELTTFAADKTKYPFFDEVREKMADAIEQGRATTYQEAYDYCVWLDPALRARALAHTNGVNQGNGIAQRQAAAGAIVPPGSAPLSKPGAEIEGDDVDSDVRRAIASLNGRA